MQIGIVGLGLLGGSLAKALKKNTPHRVFGVDLDEEVVKSALAAHAIDGTGRIEECDVVFLCLYPKAAVEYALNNTFKACAVVTDICGVKRFVSDAIAVPLRKRGIRYVGSHPMAGREVSGFAASDADLFHGASYIITQRADTDEDAVRVLSSLALSIGFASVTRSTPEEHDRIIAYTSQLAHVVSNCYMRNPDALQRGFSANSFLDLTRVAKLNPAMWAELFMENAEYLMEDISLFIENLSQIKGALLARDEESLRRLLKEGSDIKSKISAD
ncbi:MAG TPA: prephenate dehydrogenase/arogenate dehydrogenase family protein [Clostridiales bacterium]|nr:prephenate dehydrogenase/arogenate dehydrogenase family protein [Clostridiales bacterium]